MRANADAERVRAVARELARVARSDTTVYLTGGATAVIEGWRQSTVDIDLRLEPDQIEPLLFRYPAIDAADFRAKLERTLTRTT